MLGLLVSVSCCPVVLRIVEMPGRAGEQLPVLPELSDPDKLVEVDIAGVVCVVDINPKLCAQVSLNEAIRSILGEVGRSLGLHARRFENSITGKVHLLPTRNLCTYAR